MYMNGLTERTEEMNRDEKRIMRRVIQKYDSSLRNVHDDFEREIGILQYREDSKLKALPQSFENSSLAYNLTEASEMLGRILKMDEKIIDLLDDILYASGVTSSFKHVSSKTKVVREKKDVSFHALLPSSLLKRLKEESLLSGLSMNEILCQTLTKALEDN